jgi:hypothetical protein
MKKLKVTEGLIKQLEAQVFEVKEKRKKTLKTFLIDDEALALFLEVRKQVGMRIQDAASEAFREWAEKRRR